MKETRDEENNRNDQTRHTKREITKTQYRKY